MCIVYDGYAVYASCFVFNIHLIIFRRHAFGGIFFDTHNSMVDIFFPLVLLLFVMCSLPFFAALQIFVDAFGLTHQKKGQQASVCYFYFRLVFCSFALLGT